MCVLYLPHRKGHFISVCPCYLQSQCLLRPKEENCCWLLSGAQPSTHAKPWWKSQCCQVSSRLPETRYKETDFCVEGTCTWCQSLIIYTEFLVSCPNKNRWRCLLLLQESLACMLRSLSVVTSLLYLLHILLLSFLSLHALCKSG